MKFILSRSQWEQIGRIAKWQNNIYSPVESAIREINLYWMPIAQNKKEFDPNNIMFGNKKFSFLHAIDYLDDIIFELNQWKVKDYRNKSLYVGWENNVKACKSIIQNKYSQPLLF